MYPFIRQESLNVIRRNRVVITGLGILAANGIGKEAFWKTLLAGESGIAPVTLFDASELPCQIAGEVKNFDPLDFMDARMKPRRMGRFSQLGIAAATMALRDSNLSIGSLKGRADIPIIMGVSTSDFGTILAAAKSYSTPTLIPHAPAAVIASMLNLSGEIITLSNACTSGLDAIATGAAFLQNGKADLALVGGAEAAITQRAFEFLCRGNMMPENNTLPPNQVCCPFDLHRNGGVLSEGSSVFVLETLEHATERGAEIYAEILGSGRNATIIGDLESSFSEAINKTLKNSNVNISEIDYISAHAPGDPLLDKAETNAIKKVFGDRAYSIPVNSIKGATGSPLGTGGGFQCVSTVLSIISNCVHPTVNYLHVDPECDLDYIPKSPRKTTIKHALINSHGICGNNSCMVLKAVT